MCINALESWRSVIRGFLRQEVGDASKKFHMIPHLIFGHAKENKFQVLDDLAEASETLLGENHSRMRRARVSQAKKIRIVREHHPSRRQRPREVTLVSSASSPA